MPSVIRVLREHACIDAGGIALFLLVDAALFISIITLVRRWWDGGAAVPYIAAALGCGIGGYALPGQGRRTLFYPNRARGPARYRLIFSGVSGPPSNAPITP